MMDHFGIGIDIGGSKTVIVIMDPAGKVHYREKLESSRDWTVLESITRKTLDCVPLVDRQISSLGVGVAGMVNCHNGVVIDAPALQWRNLDLLDKMKSLFEFPVYINNDVNCALMAEKWMGAGKSCDDLFLIALGTGVGSAIIANGNLVYGANFMAGEIGFWIEKEDHLKGKKNAFEHFGVAEHKISGTALGELFSSSMEFFELYEKGDPEARVVMDEFTLDLAILIANAVSLLNPERVILSGGVAESLQKFLGMIQQKATELADQLTAETRFQRHLLLD